MCLYCSSCVVIVRVRFQVPFALWCVTFVVYVCTAVCVRVLCVCVFGDVLSYGCLSAGGGPEHCALSRGLVSSPRETGPVSQLG